MAFGMHECIPYESSAIFPFNILPQISLPGGTHKCVPYEHIPTNTNLLRKAEKRISKFPGRELFLLLPFCRVAGYMAVGLMGPVAEGFPDADA